MTAAAGNPTDSEVGTETFHGAASHLNAVAAELGVDLPDPVHVRLGVGMDAHDLLLQLGIALGTSRDGA
jgi:hypothetical protein